MARWWWARAIGENLTNNQESSPGDQSWRPIFASSLVEQYNPDFSLFALISMARRVRMANGFASQGGQVESKFDYQGTHH
jgi:hypothetical protein